VITPTGNCCGAIIVRAIVSESTSRLPPARTEVGASHRWSLPISKRIMCGIIKPTKPILPACVTALAVRADASKNRLIRRGFSETPKTLACISPRDNIFNDRAKAKQSARPTINIMGNKGLLSWFAWVPLKSPINQNSMPLSDGAGLDDKMKLMIAPQPEAITTPVSKSRDGLQLPRPWAIPNTSMIEVSAPKKALADIMLPARPADIAKMAATEAPPDTPNI